MKARVVVTLFALVGVGSAIGFAYFLGESQAESRYKESMSDTATDSSGFSGIEAYKAGVQKLLSGGPDEAEIFFDEEIKKTGDLRALFGKAVALFGKQDYKESERLVIYIIQSSEEDVLTMMSYYMLGLIRNATGDFEKALQHLSTALEYFQNTNDVYNSFSSHLAFASVYLQQKRFVLADEHLNKAYALPRTKRNNLSYFYHLKAKLNFFRGNIRRALEFANLSLEEYRNLGYKDGISSSLCMVGLFEILRGNLQEGYNKTMESQAMFEPEEFKRKDFYFYHAVNRMILQKCEGGTSYMVIVSEILDHLKEKEDPRLQFLLDYAIKWDCQPLE